MYTYDKYLYLVCVTLQYIFLAMYSYVLLLCMYIFLATYVCTSLCFNYYLIQANTISSYLFLATSTGNYILRLNYNRW